MRKRFSGKNLYRAPLLLGATLMLSACGLWQDSSEPPAQPETPPDMQVDVKLRALHRCSRISPEMVVTNVPKGTDYFDVRLLENEPQERLLGGGNWENDGTGIIPEGALTRVYTIHELERKIKSLEVELKQSNMAREDRKSHV